MKNPLFDFDGDGKTDLLEFLTGLGQDPLNPLNGGSGVVFGNSCGNNDNDDDDDDFYENDDDDDDDFYENDDDDDDDFYESYDDDDDDDF